MSYSYQEIADATGFNEGEEFDSPEQVREYFTRENMAMMFDMALVDVISQEELDEMAHAVIENRWWCNF